MIDIKQLKGNLDLAQMNHAAFNTEASRTALEKAQADYNTALASTSIIDGSLSISQMPATPTIPTVPTAVIDVPTGLLVTADHDKAGLGGSGEGNNAQKKSVS